MSGRTRAERLAASPTVVGAITTLIIIVAVFLAYNASNGLPFVPVYRISAELPNGSRLVRNNEVRIGGHRVGVIESIETTRDRQTGEAAAKLNLKLDKSVKPLPATTQVRVRYRSSFGLKYLELVRRPGAPLAEGATIPVSQGQSQTEFDAISNTFDTNTRENIRSDLEGFGNAFAARGASLNQAIQELNPLFANLEPVAKTLAAPSTRLDRFFPSLAATARIVAPVAVQNSQLFTNMASTFAALSFDPKALQDTITSSVPTLETGIRALPKIRPFLANLADFERILRPGVADLQVALPTLNDALAIGTPVLLRLPQFNNDLKDALTSLNLLVTQPQTLLSIQRLEKTFDSALPLGQHILPYETVCNYANYWLNEVPEVLSQLDGPNGAGTTLRNWLTVPPAGTTLPGTPPLNQYGSIAGYAGVSANGRAGILPDPTKLGQFQPHNLNIFHAVTGGPAQTPDGQPDCQGGQTGYVLGDLRLPGQPKSNPAIGVPDLPGARGRTGLYYHANGTRELNHVYPLSP